MRFSKTEQAHERPIFTFTMHRSGGTLLARLLNAHPDVVIWGEHGGWINKLAEVDATLACMPEVVRPISERKLEAYSSGQAIDSFEPWASPFEIVDFRQASRDLIRSTFSKSVGAHQRWGFKEIRYHQPITAKFLADLFPMASFLLLRRNPIKVVASSVLAPWETKDPRLARAQSSTTTRSIYDLARAVLDCSYAVAVMEHGFEAIEKMLPDRCMVLQYEDLTKSIEDLLRFLALDDSEHLQQRLSAVLKVKTGRTPNASSKRRIFIEKLGALGLNSAKKHIASEGIDWCRLKRLKGGNFSYMLGDHSLAHTPLTSMF